MGWPWSIWQVITSADPAGKAFAVRAGLAYARLALLAIIGMFFFQDGLTISAWGDGSLHTASLLGQGLGATSKVEQPILPSSSLIQHLRPGTRVLREPRRRHVLGHLRISSRLILGSPIEDMQKMRRSIAAQIVMQSTAGIATVPALTRMVVLQLWVGHSQHRTTTSTRVETMRLGT